ncbi:hypothetical protein [Bacteroides rodentium]
MQAGASFSDSLGKGLVSGGVRVRAGGLFGDSATCTAAISTDVLRGALRAVGFIQGAVCGAATVDGYIASYISSKEAAVIYLITTCCCRFVYPPAVAALVHGSLQVSADSSHGEFASCRLLHVTAVGAVRDGVATACNAAGVGVVGGRFATGDGAAVGAYGKSG